MELVKINRRVVLVGMLGCLLGQTVCLAELKFGDQVKGNENVLLGEHLGVDEAVVVSNGYVFVDSAYVPGPYRLQRIGQGVTLNGMLINELYTEPVSWTNEVVKSNAPIADPEMPKGIKESDVFYAQPISGFLENRKKYLYSKYSKDEARTRLAEVVRSLPCVEKAEISGSGTAFLKVFHKNGETILYHLTLKYPFSGKSRNSKGVMKSLAEVQVKKMKNTLSWSGCIFLTSTPAKKKALVHVKGDWSSRDFGPVQTILNSTITRKGKIKKLLERNLKGMRTKEAAGLFLDRHEASEVFKERLKRK